MKQIKAPWTDEQVAALNRWQQRGNVHPFTCGASEPHPVGPPGSDSFKHRETNRTLIAENDGWHCPTCRYTQDWAWDAMFNVNPFNHAAAFWFGI